MISDLPRDMVEEVFSRLPLTSLREVRFTCKAWNTLSKDRSFTKKYISEAKAAAENKQRKEFQMVMLLEHKVYLISVNILNPSMERTGKLVNLDDDAAADRVEICNIFHCDGLLLCVTKDIMNSGLVVWNPFSEETRWIQPRDSYHRYDSYALGYEKKNKYSLRSHKVLRFVDAYDRSVKRQICEFEIYNLNSDSWKVLDVNLDWEIQGFHRGLSLKGNTYWFAAEKHVGARLGSRLFLLCFDFTTERFGPSLRLPFRGHYLDTVKLSSVREEQLAVLIQEIGAPAYTLKIWISSKIEPNAVSWNELFLDVDMKPLTGFPFLNGAGSFFVDVKKEVVVVIDITTRNMAYIIGKDGYFKQVDLGDFAYGNCWPLVCSYVPSSVKIKQPYVPSSVKIKKPYVPSSEKIKQPYVPSSVKIKQPAPRGNQLDKHFSPVPSTLIIIFLLIFCCSLVYSMFSCTLG